jgi:hypothetical protein
MTTKARVAATLYGTVRKAEADSDYHTKVMLEYYVLHAPHRNAKVPIEVIDARNESDFREQIREGLLTYLNDKYPGSAFVARDIMLFGL